MFVALLLAAPAEAVPASTPDWEIGGGMFAHLGWLVTVGDVNGDGYDDIVTANWSDALETSSVGVFLGSPTGPGLAPDATVPFREYPLVVGDFDGDGYDDILAGDQVYEGSAAGPSAQPIARPVLPYEAVAGDFDADGDDDLASTATWESNDVDITAGGPDGLADAPSVRLHTPVEAAPCDPAFLPVDAETDGTTDLAVMCSNGGDALQIFAGGVEGLSQDRLVTLFPVSAVNPYLVANPVATGDVDADGWLDLVVAEPGAWNGNAFGAGSVHVLAGGPDGFGETPIWEVLGGRGGLSFGAGVGVGDFDRDGDDDLFAGAPGTSNGDAQEGAVLMFESDPAGIGVVPAWTFEGGEGGAQVGSAVAMGDLDGDGDDDLVLGSEYADGSNGVLRAFFGDGAPIDQDDDGFTTDDCDDLEPSVHPGATEIDGDGVDQSCDGLDAALGIADLAPGALRITEVMLDPEAVPAERGQWFELELTAPGPVDLVGLTITTDGITTDGITIVDGFLVVAPGARAVVARQADPSLNGGIEPAFAADTLALSAALSIGTADATLDALDLSALPVAAGVSAGLDVDGTWCLATSSYGAGDLGTPGAANDPCGAAGTTPGDTSPAPESPDSTAADSSGCGCDHGGAPATFALVLLAPWVRRRTSPRRHR